MTEKNDISLQVDGEIEKPGCHWKISITAIRRLHTILIFTQVQAAVLYLFYSCAFSLL